MREEIRFEITARCPLDCRHCAVNRPEGDKSSRKRELGAGEIGRIAGEAAALGFTAAAITGGEPVVRPDFFDVYQAVLSKGLLVSVATSATRVSEEFVRFLKKFPPRFVEVPVFGASRETFDRVTRTPGSYAAFKNGLDRLLAGGVNVRLRAMALRSNKHEIPALAEFGRSFAKGAFVIAPHLDLRYDRDEARNILIRAERLSPREIVRLERSGPDNVGPVAPSCAGLGGEGLAADDDFPERRRLFRCAAGGPELVVDPAGFLRPCPPFSHPDFLVDLRKVSLSGALERFLPQALGRRTVRGERPEACAACRTTDHCSWCPARSYLETGKLDKIADGLCELAGARAEGLS